MLNRFLHLVERRERCISGSYYRWFIVEHIVDFALCWLIRSFALTWGDVEFPGVCEGGRLFLIRAFLKSTSDQALQVFNVNAE